MLEKTNIQEKQLIGVQPLLNEFCRLSKEFGKFLGSSGIVPSEARTPKFQSLKEISILKESKKFKLNVKRFGCERSQQLDLQSQYRQRHESDSNELGRVEFTLGRVSRVIQGHNAREDHPLRRRIFLRRYRDSVLSNKGREEGITGRILQGLGLRAVAQSVTCYFLLVLA